MKEFKVFSKKINSFITFAPNAARPAYAGNVMAYWSNSTKWTQGTYWSNSTKWTQGTYWNNSSHWGQGSSGGK